MNAARGRLPSLKGMIGQAINGACFPDNLTEVLIDIEYLIFQVIIGFHGFLGGNDQLRLKKWDDALAAIIPLDPQIQS
jgi:hypothetical protein